MSDRTSPETVPPHRRRRRPLRRLAHGGLWLVLLTLLAVLLLGVAALVLTDRRLSFPDSITRQVEQRINADFAGGSIDIGRLELIVDRRGVPRLSAHNVDLRDRGGVGILRLGDVRASFDPVSLLRGKASIRRLSLEGAEVTLRRGASGGFSLSFGQGARSFAGLGGLLDAMDDVFRAPPFDTTDLIQAAGLTVVVEDARSGRVWQITGGRLQLERLEEGLDLTVWAEIFNGTDDLAEAQMSLSTRFDGGAAVIAAKVDGVAARDVALQSPALSFLSVLDAPISGALRTEFDDGGVARDLAGSLDIGAGEVRPTPGARPLKFDGARAYFAYDADRSRITFSELSAQAEALRFTATGHSYLREIGPDGWPGALVSQFRFSGLEFVSEDLFDGPVQMESGAIDLRFRPDPFRIEIGQLVLMEEVARTDEHLRLKGSVAADAKGWSVALDLAVERLPVARLKALWPRPLAPRTREWVSKRILAGTATQVRASVRLAPGEPRQIGLTTNYEGGEVRYLDRMPVATGLAGYLTIGQERMSLAVEAGRTDPELGGPVELAGSSLVIPDMRGKPALGQFDIASDSSLTGLLSLLTNPPVGLFREGGTPVIAEARADIRTRLEIPLGRRLTPDEVDFDARGRLTGFVSETLVEGRRLTASSIAVEATPVALIAEGRALLDGVPVSGRWRNGLTPEEAGRSEVRGTVELSGSAAETFGILLPPGSVAGSGSGDFQIALEKDKPPAFLLTSDLQGLRLRLDPVNWTKPPGASGSLSVEGTLGDTPTVSRLEISGAGLSASGALDLGPDGTFRAARFGRVRIGGWLDAPVTLTARGGQPPAIALSGGTFDMRNSRLGGNSAAARGPVAIRLDRLILSEGITLTRVAGELEPGRSLNGAVTARVNGQTPIRATLVEGNVRVRSDDAGGAIRDAGLLGNARGGDLDLILQPTGAAGTYDGLLRVTGTRVLDAPAMAELLNALSLVGILDQMANGTGIGFDDVEARFRLTPDQVVLYQSSAVGASMGLSMDGTFDLASKAMNLQGVISPFYFVNAIGSILTRKGEGLIGINFNLAGTPSDPKVAVNPLSILTPGMFREIFRRPPPSPD